MLARLRPGLGDYSVDGRRVTLLCILAVVIGAAATLVAKILLVLIGAITNLAYFGRLSGGLAQPDPRHWGPIAIVIPIVGGIVVGSIARFFTDKIRGHGIPEAIQAILEHDSVVQARVAFWKPIASAIAIGTGSPFGAEGPIIMTGGGIGSLFAQFLHLSSLERRTLLVAGAAAGMSATFGAPIASVLIAVELLLFEWRPRSFIPVATASFVAVYLRTFLIGPLPPFMAASTLHAGASDLGWALILGLGGGLVSLLMTRLVYITEDLYAKLPIHWMWWPAIGGAVVGIGGWFAPAALGVGYPTIDAMINGRLAIETVAVILVIKIIIWVCSLSSGTSGGVLAPLLMIGAALGTLLATLIPGHHDSVWAIVGMAALVGGTMRAPFMGTLFALETTRAWNLAPEIFAACITATAFTVLFVPRSILTEKLARRGMHVAREYAVDPLELTSVGSVMNAGDDNVAADAEVLHPDDRVRSVVDRMATTHTRAFIVVDEQGQKLGTFGVEELLQAWRHATHGETRRLRVRLLRRMWQRRSHTRT
jgi:chloride channel protein, CIC family